MHISANGPKYFAHPPIFISDTNTATLRFTSDRSISDEGILIAYFLGK